MLHRLNVSITGIEGALGGHYLPSWSEVFITLMMVALGFAACGVAVRHFNVYPPPSSSPPPAPGASSSSASSSPSS
jgi:hypothetical protein